MILKKLPRSFYLRPTLQVARELLGKYFVRHIGKARLIGKIVEVEAYLGERDPASHAYRGQTPRNEVMFRKGGHLYVYFTYGMHFCCNVVTGAEGKGRAILLRAVEPIEGVGKMMKRRGLTRQKNGGQAWNYWNDRDARKPDEQGSVIPNLTNGPAKFCQAFGIGRKENGIDLLDGEIYLTEGEKIAPRGIVVTERIGINQGKEKKWRFVIAGSKFASRKH